MTFEDKIEIQLQTYSAGYAIVGGKAYSIKNGEVTTEQVGIREACVMFDENMDARQPSSTFFLLANCFISFNSQAQKIHLHDGSDYVYSYYVILPLKKSIYHLIPREGDVVRITKADGTINAEKEVKGFVTYKKRYLKIWL